MGASRTGTGAAHWDRRGEEGDCELQSPPTPSHSSWYLFGISVANPGQSVGGAELLAEPLALRLAAAFATDKVPPFLSVKVVSTPHHHPKPPAPAGVSFLTFVFLLRPLSFSFFPTVASDAVHSPCPGSPSH